VGKDDFNEGYFSEWIGHINKQFFIIKEDENLC